MSDWLRMGIAVENICKGDYLELDCSSGAVRKLTKETIEYEYKEEKANQEIKPLRKEDPNPSKSE